MDIVQEDEKAQGVVAESAQAAEPLSPAPHAVATDAAMDQGPDTDAGGDDDDADIPKMLRSMSGELDARALTRSMSMVSRSAEYLASVLTFRAQKNKLDELLEDLNDGTDGTGGYAAAPEEEEDETAKLSRPYTSSLEYLDDQFQLVLQVLAVRPCTSAG